MQTKVKVRLGRYLGFEIHSPKQPETVSQLKAEIRYLEAQLALKQHYIDALVEGYTYIRDFSNGLYRLYNDGTVVDQYGSTLNVDWNEAQAFLPDGTSVEFHRRIDGALKKWAKDENGKLVEVQ